MHGQDLDKLDDTRRNGGFTESLQVFNDVCCLREGGKGEGEGGREGGST